MLLKNHLCLFFVSNGFLCLFLLGLVPLDELYRLNQIIQEATRREQCLETKLTALKHFTEEAKKSADYTWQVRQKKNKCI